tara:strand:+ start:138 stop:836 length:699 start_codon:yes stop_codon:yes gene_type:complete
MPFRIILTFLLFLICSFPTWAEEDPDLKAKFLSAWEAHQKSLPTTVALEKTDEPNIYNFETALFPYRGKLQVNNILISRDLDYYYDYNLGAEYALKGVAETELLDISSDDLYRKYPQSQQLWAKEQYLFWDDSQKKWLSADEWKNASAVVSHEEMTSPYNKPCVVTETLMTIWPFLVILLFLMIFLARIKQLQKQQFEKFDLSIERQLESLELQKQSLELQREILKVLKQKT